MLEIKNLVCGYGDMTVLYDVSLTVGEGETVALVGSNGAGKTTLLRAISGLIPLKSGEIRFQGQDISRVPAHQLPDLGIAHVPQGRGILASLTVWENLVLGAHAPRAAKRRAENLDKMMELFPILGERRNQNAGTLSGGEQQMLALARALMLEPELMILDEPSLGLAPIVVETVFRIIKDISQRGVSILLIEQNLVEALKVAKRGYVLETGRITLTGPSEELLANPAVREAYLGL
ncbi:MAG: ABC transporter ATP-binding protein [Betaproteobacteria bacterium]